ncbi:MAG TPA: DUF6789 family protein [Bryobacteraceae bacterium]|nr:DUF6789 family protein [Bryobacteraceae bacterium]
MSLAGLQSGMAGALCYLAWMGAASKYEQSSFWTSENLMASVFYGGDAIRGRFTSSTLSGLALYLLLYSLLGAGFAAAFQDRMPRPRLALCGILFGLGWYWISFGMLWKYAAPLIPLLHAERPTVWGHMLYGAVLARYPRYLPRARAPEPPPAE